jgi:hypothetical protein
MSTETITPETFDLLDWIQTGTVARRQVPIFIDHAAFAEYQRLTGRLKELGWSALEATRAERPADGPLDEPVNPHTEEIAALEEELAGVEERLFASRMVWTVRALSRDEIEATFDQCPDPKLPVPPKDGAAKAVHDKWMEKVSENQKGIRNADRTRELLMIQAATESVETARGVRDEVTVEELRAIRSRPHGAAWMDQLSEAIAAATNENAEPPVPTLPARSTSTRG